MAGGLAWSAVAGPSRKAAPPTPASRRDGGGGREADAGAECTERNGEGVRFAPTEGDGFGGLMACPQTGSGKESERELVATAAGESGEGLQEPAAGESLVVADAASEGGGGYERRDRHWGSLEVDRAAMPRPHTRELQPQILASFSSTYMLTTTGSVGSSTDLIAENTNQDVFHKQSIGVTNSKIEHSRKLQDFDPRVVAHHVSSGKNWPVVGGGNNSTGTLRKNRLHSSRKHHFSSLRLWIIILLLSCGVNSVNGQSCAANQNICPAPRGQFKRVLQGDFFKSEEAMCKECGLEESEEKKAECKEIRFDETVARAAGMIFMFFANAGPIVAIKRISEVTPHRKQMLCDTSASFAASSFLWLVYFGPEDCLNWPSYISFAIACSLHGYFCWFFWQQAYGSISLQSFTALIGSCILTSAAAFISRTFVGIITSTVAGVLGVAFTVLAIYNRRRSTGPRPDGNLDINVICAFIGTASFMYCIKWWDYELNELSSQLKFFKFGAILLSALRVCEVCELCWFYCMRDRASSDELTVSLMQPGTGSDSAGTTSTIDAGSGLPPTDSRSVSETADGTNRGNATNGVPDQNGETGGLGRTEPNAGTGSDSAATTPTIDPRSVLPPTGSRNVLETADGTNRGNARNGAPDQNGETDGLGRTEPNAEISNGGTGSLPNANDQGDDQGGGP